MGNTELEADAERFSEGLKTTEIGGEVDCVWSFGLWVSMRKDTERRCLVGFFLDSFDQVSGAASHKKTCPARVGNQSQAGGSGGPPAFLPIDLHVSQT
jgi:hypothetical protein